MMGFTVSAYRDCPTLRLADRSALCRTLLLRGTALAGGVVGLLAGAPAWAQQQCGAPANGQVKCSAANNPYPDGVGYARINRDLTITFEDGAQVKTTDPDAIGVVATIVSPEGLGSLYVNAPAGTSINTADATGVQLVAERGDVGVNIDTVSIGGNGNGSVNSRAGIRAVSDLGNVAVTANRVTTSGSDSIGMIASTVDGSINLAAGTIQTTGADNALGVLAETNRSDANGGDITLKVGNVSTTGSNSQAVAMEVRNQGNITANIGTVNTVGANSFGVAAQAASGSTALAIGSATTQGDGARAIIVSGPASATLTVSGNVTTTGSDARAIGVFSSNGLASSATTGAITTTGSDSTAVLVQGNAAAVNASGAITTSGDRSNGIDATGVAGVNVVATGPVATRGANADGIVAAATNGAATINARGVTAAGAGSNAISAAGTTAAITIASGSTVSGANDSVRLVSANGATLTNAGTITTGSGYAVNASGGAATVNNNGVISGRISLSEANDVVNNAGTFVATADSRFGAGTDTFNNSGTVTLGRGSAARSVSFTGLEAFNNTGLVELRNGVIGDRLTLPGTFTGSGASTLGLDVVLGASPAGDLLNVGTAAGSTQIALATPDGNASFVKRLDLVHATAASPAGAFSLTPSSQRIGFVRYTLNYDPATFAYYLAGTADDTVYETGGFIGGATELWHKTADVVDAHLRSLRDAGWAGGDERRIGNNLWMQMYGEANSLDRTRTITAGTTAIDVNLDRSQDSFGGQIGYDFGNRDGASGFAFGVTGGYQTSILRYSRTADRISFDEVNGGAYALFNSGRFFAHVLGKYDHYWATARLYALNFSTDLDGDSYGAQGQAGVRFGSDRFFAEPLVTVAYVHATMDDLTAFGTTIDYDGFNSLRGKAGLRIGGAKELSNGAKMTFYASGEAVKEFKGRDTITASNLGGEFDFKGDRLPLYGRGTLGINIASPTDRVSGFIEGFGNYAGDYQGGGGRAGLSIKF